MQEEKIGVGLKASIAISLVVGFIFILFFGYLCFGIYIASNFVSTPDEEVLKGFEAHIEDFERVKEKAIEEYNKPIEKDSYTNFEVLKVDAITGNLSLFDSNLKNGDGDWVSQKTAPEIRASVKRLCSYLGEYFADVCVNESRIEFRFGGKNIVYSRDGSVPPFTIHPMENLPSRHTYSLKGDWYYIEA